MGFEQRKQERQALVQHLLAQDWHVFGALKFVNGRTIGRESANKLLRSYWNKIDRVIYGRAAERQNMRVARWCFAHEGVDHENFHVHFVIPSPLQDTEQMCCVTDLCILCDLSEPILLQRIKRSAFAIVLLVTNSLRCLPVSSGQGGDFLTEG